MRGMLRQPAARADRGTARARVGPGSDLRRRADGHVAHEMRVTGPGLREDDVAGGICPAVRQLDGGQVQGRDVGAERDRPARPAEPTLARQAADPDGQLLLFPPPNGGLYLYPP